MRGAAALPPGPLLLVANHASHADTALLLRAMPRRLRSRCAPAAAADYFFRNRVAGALTSLLTGAFPFARRGGDGLRRARTLLARGRSVLLFPEGTRSVDGSIAPFKRGAGLLAVAAEATVVPVGLAGTGEVLPKGRRRPRRAPCAVVFGDPIRVRAGDDPGAVAARLESAVRACAATARAIRPPARPSWFARARAFASSPAGLAVAFAWGVAEAVAWPIVPDLLVASLALAAPRRALHVAAAAIAGSVCGGAIAYGLGAAFGAGFLEHAPLVTEPMRAAAAERLAADGPTAVLTQPLSGIPYKVFAWQAGDAGAGLGGLAWHTLLARGARIATIAAGFSLAGLATRRRIASFYAPLVAASTTGFALLLARVVARWS